LVLLLRPCSIRRESRAATCGFAIAAAGSGRRSVGLPLVEADRLRALPEAAAAELREALETLDDGGEVVPGESAGLAREGAVAVREEELGLAYAARVEQELAGGGVCGRVLR